MRPGAHGGRLDFGHFDLEKFMGLEIPGENIGERQPAGPCEVQEQQYSISRPGGWTNVPPRRYIGTMNVDSDAIDLHVRLPDRYVALAQVFVALPYRLIPLEEISVAFSYRLISLEEVGIALGFALLEFEAQLPPRSEKANKSEKDHEIPLVQ
jgi:hypothetical protein